MKVNVNKVKNNKTLIYCCVLSKNEPFTFSEIVKEIQNLRNNITKYEIGKALDGYLQTGLVKHYFSDKYIVVKGE